MTPLPPHPGQPPACKLSGGRDQVRVIPESSPPRTRTGPQRARHSVFVFHPRLYTPPLAAHHACCGCSLRRAPRTELLASLPARGRAAPQHRLGPRGPGHQVDRKEGRPIRKDMELPHSLPLTQPTRVAARTQQCSRQIQRPQRMPRGLWAQQPTGLQKAPSPGETDTLAAPLPAPPALPSTHSPSVLTTPCLAPCWALKTQAMTDGPAGSQEAPAPRSTSPNPTPSLASCLTHTDPEGRHPLPKSLQKPLPQRGAQHS